MTPCEFIAKMYVLLLTTLETVKMENRQNSQNTQNIIEMQNIKYYIPITMYGVNGKYSIMNGLYLPVYNNQIMDILYKKADNSQVTIQYCNKRSSWKVYDERNGTLARISTRVRQIPLDDIGLGYNTYWEVYNESLNGYEIQPFVRISII